MAVGSQTRAGFDMKKVRIVPTVIHAEYSDVSFIMKMKIFKKMRVIFYTTDKKARRYYLTCPLNRNARSETDTVQYKNRSCAILSLSYDL